MTRQFKVTVNGREYDVSVLEVTPLSQLATSAAPAGIAHDPAVAPPTAPQTAVHSTTVPAASPGDIVAGMGGVVVEIHVNVGQSVAAGDHLLVLEAMKMKNTIRADRAGKITAVYISNGDTVKHGQTLVDF